MSQRIVLGSSAHIDTFARDRLPAVDTWPTLEFTIPEVQYPERLNAAEALLDQTIARYGSDRVALIVPAAGKDRPDLRWTYGELRDHVDRIAHALVDDFGIVPGNRVILRIPNNEWAVATWLAVIKVGAVVVTTMVAWNATELGKTASRTLPSLMLVDHRFAAGITEDDVAGARIVIVGGEADELLRAAAEKPSSFDAVDTSADDVVLLGPTSGTTGQPKITMHFHRDVLAIADTFAVRELRLQPDDIAACSAPFAFTFGLGALVVFPLRTGGAAVLLEKGAPTVLADVIEQYGVTILFTAPTGYRTLLKEGRADALRRLRIGVSAGEHLPKDTFEQVERQTGLRLVNGIGGTEMLHVFLSATGDDIRPGATGRPIAGFRAAILDDEGNELPDGAQGRLAVIGPTGCRYLDDERQSVYVQNGWNITGDSYIRDEDGYYHYQSRIDDIIVTAGYNVGALEIEILLNEHPAVVESAVVGRPDPEKGMIVNAFVVLAADAQSDEGILDSLRDHLKERVVSYKLPRRFDVVDELPHNASGKLQRFPLRQRAAEDAAALAR